MSYDYSLTLTTALSAEKAIHLVSEMPSFETVPDVITNRNSIFGPGIVVSISPADAEDKEYGLEFEGFAPDLRVSLTQKYGNKDEHIETSSVIQVSMLLLHHSTGAAVLRAEDSLWLRLENNVLWLNSERALWREHQDLLPMITMPYRVAALPDATLTPS